VVEKYPVRIILTADQRETVRTMSGQNIQAIELSPSDGKTGEGPLRFLWRRAAGTKPSADKGSPSPTG